MSVALKQTDFLDDVPVAPSQRKSSTSRDAAEQIQPHLGRLQQEVLDFLDRVMDGATDEEMQRWLNMNPSTQRPRRIELHKKGLIRDSGRKRSTMSGRLATVWEVVR